MNPGLIRLCQYVHSLVHFVSFHKIAERFCFRVRQAIGSVIDCKISAK
jgi:hypothetical protein